MAHVEVPEDEEEKKMNAVQRTEIKFAASETTSIGEFMNSRRWKKLQTATLYSSKFDTTRIR